MRSSGSRPDTVRVGSSHFRPCFGRCGCFPGTRTLASCDPRPTVDPRHRSCSRGLGPAVANRAMWEPMSISLFDLPGADVISGRAASHCCAETRTACLCREETNCAGGSETSESDQCESAIVRKLHRRNTVSVDALLDGQRAIRFNSSSRGVLCGPSSAFSSVFSLSPRRAHRIPRPPPQPELRRRTRQRPTRSRPAPGRSPQRLSWDTLGANMVMVLVCGSSDVQTFGAAASLLDHTGDGVRVKQFKTAAI